MGILDIFRKKPVEQQGTIYITPEEKTQVTGESGADIVVAETGETFDPTTKTFSGGYTGATSGGGASGGSTPTTPYEQATGDTTPATKTREYSEQAATIRGEATKRGIDISTPAKEVGFISQLKSESVRQDIEGETTSETIRPTGTVMPVETDRSLDNLFGVGEWIEKKQSQYTQRPTRSGGFSPFIEGISSFGLGVLSVQVGLGKAFLNPIETGKGIGTAIIHPIQTGRALKQSVSMDIKRNPTSFFGEMAGFYGASKVIDIGVRKLPGYARTIGREEIPIEKLVPKDVLTGSKHFPEAGGGSPLSTAKTHLKTFTDSQYKLPGQTEAGGFHATGKVFAKGDKAVVGEAPLHISSAVSSNFLDIGGYGGKSTFFLKSLFQRPGVMQVTPRKFEINIGHEIGRAKGYKWTRPTETGTAYIPGTKKEIQALLETGTELGLQRKKYFSRFEGVRFPIDEFKVFGDTKKVSKKTGKTTGRRSSFSYSGLPSSKTYGSSSFPLFSYGFKPFTSSRSRPYRKSEKKPYGYSSIAPFGSYTAPMSSKYSPLGSSRSVLGKSGYSGYSSIGSSKIFGSGTGKKIFDLPKMKMVETKSKITGKRGFYYQPGLAALGLNLYDTKESSLAWTGLATRKRIRRKK